MRFQAWVRPAVDKGDFQDGRVRSGQAGACQK
jgi:hypothetical protein